jgi:gliding motility-associated-like protein
MRSSMLNKAQFSFVFFFFFITALVHSQVGSFTPTVIGTSGGTATGAGFSLFYSIGETVVPTASSGNLILTQGFEQPSSSAILGLHFTIGKTDLTCAGANDGTAQAKITSGNPPFIYSWNTRPAQTSEIATGLLPGIYAVTISDASGFTSVDSVIVNDNHNICGIHVYSGFSPNGDGKNDSWIIDYIDVFQPNTVEIFNRWGDQVWAVDNYDNTSHVFTGNDKTGSALPDGTYFYLIKMGPNEQKGWVEISR